MIHHTDRGSQYCTNAYRELLSEVELGDHFSNRRRGKQELFKYLEGFYNTRRLHSGLGYRTPAKVERAVARHQEAA